MNQELKDLEQRIRRLESQNRRLKGIGIDLVVFAMSSTVWAQVPKNLAIQAQKFQLRDDAGRLRAELSMLNGSLRFAFSASMSRPRVSLTAIPSPSSKEAGAKQTSSRRSTRMGLHSRTGEIDSSLRSGLMNRTKLVSCS